MLNQLVDADEEGRPRADVVTLLSGYLDTGAGLEPEIDTLVERGLVTQDPGPGCG